MSNQLFPRSKNPLVSVLLPTRGRPDKLSKSIDSLVSLCSDINNVEFILRVDNDDADTIQTAERIRGVVPNFSVIKLPRGKGYCNIHRWLNGMANLASGDWLFVWNDDAVMKTEKWDYVLGSQLMNDDAWHGVTDVCCLVPDMENDPGCTAFFFLRRKVVELLGRLSFIPHCDTWISGLMRSIESLFFTYSIRVAHEQAKDHIFVESNDVRSTTKYTTHNRGATIERLKDAIKLQKYIDTHRGNLCLD